MEREILWICPTLCDCAIEATHKWSLSLERMTAANTLTPRLVPFLVERAEREADLDYIQSSFRILQTCPEHYCGPDEADRLWAELHRYDGQTWGPISCQCQLSLYTDKLEPLRNGVKVQHPVPHPFISQYCEAHEHLANDPERHYATVMEETALMNRGWSLASQALRFSIAIKALKGFIAPAVQGYQIERERLQHVPFTFDPERRLILHPRKLDLRFRPVVRALAKANADRIIVSSDWAEAA